MSHGDTIAIENGKRLRELRGIRTRTGVSKELGIPYSSMEAYETGIRTPSPNTQKKIAAYYGVPVNQIFLPTNNRKSIKDNE